MEGTSLELGAYPLVLLSSCLIAGLGLVDMDIVGGEHSNLATCMQLHCCIFCCFHVIIFLQLKTIRSLVHRCSKPAGAKSLHRTVLIIMRLCYKFVRPKLKTACIKGSVQTVIVRKPPV